MRIEIQKLGSHQIGTFIELIDVFEEVFEMENFKIPRPEHLQELLQKDDFFVFIALSEGRIVGGLTAYSLTQYYSEAPLVYVYDVAVLKKYQHKGVGKKLMLAINDYCKEMGVEEVFVQATDTDEHAIEFYRSTGAQWTKVTHFYYPLG
jgi:aminoglycoside 3-N-acetyltransferase I